MDVINIIKIFDKNSNIRRVKIDSEKNLSKEMD